MRSRLPTLDGLRALAALAVLTFHVWLYRDGSPARMTGGDATDGLLSSLRIALVMFFVLSGFLLARDLRGWLAGGLRGTIRRYAARRALRILPAYWLSLAGAVVLLWGGEPAHGIRLPPEERLWVFLVLGQNYLEDTVMRLNPVTWTLVVEVAFYVLLPLLAAVLAAARTRDLLPAGLLLLLAALVANLLADRQEWGLTARKALPPYLGYFAIGILVARLAERRRRPLGPRATAAAAAGGLTVVAAWSWWELAVDDAARDPVIGVLQHLPAAAGFGALVWAAVRGGGPLARALGWRPLAALGLVSYGVFLWHLPILLALNRLAEMPPGLLWVATLALTVPVALLSWRLVERPALAATRAPATLPRPWTSSRRSSSASSRG